jgi:hypothetical protein
VTESCLPTDYLNQFAANVKHFWDDVIQGTSDRTAIIVGAAMLEFQLEELLKAFLQPTTKSHDDLFEGENPLSTFAAKITLANRLGVLHEEETAILRGIKRLRNAFAHQLSARSLNDSPHKDVITHVVSQFGPAKTEFLRATLNLPDTPSGKIRAAMQGVSAFLAFLRSHVVRPIDAWQFCHFTKRDEGKVQPNGTNAPTIGGGEKF